MRSDVFEVDDSTFVDERHNILPCLVPGLFVDVRPLTSAKRVAVQSETIPMTKCLLIKYTAVGGGGSSTTSGGSDNKSDQGPPEVAVVETWTTTQTRARHRNPYEPSDASPRSDNYL